MQELKAFVLRLLAAAFLVTVCLTVSRAADTKSQDDLGIHAAPSSLKVSFQQ